MAAKRVFLAGIGLLAIQVGCVFDPSAPERDEIPSDTEPVEGYDCAKWDPGPQLVDACDLGEPRSPLSLRGEGEYVYDTDTSTLVTPDGVETILPSVELTASNVDLNVVFTESIEIGQLATLRAIGSRALVLASATSIKIAGGIDVSSGSYGDGAGANAGCTVVASHDGLPSDPTNKGASGAAGGSLFDLGGAGAIGASDGGAPVGGIATLTLSTAAAIHPGCPGGAGGIGTSDTDIGAPGSGGGAVLLAAIDRIAIDGTIDAGGAGGSTGTNWGGGGGGGSGGFIGVVADEVVISGSLTAHGGGGAGAASHELAGTAGQDARVAGQLPATGGTVNHAHAGRGGDGATCNVAAQVGEAVDGGDSGGGGGGGLGSVGLIAHAMLQLTPGAYATGYQCQ